MKIALHRKGINQRIYIHPEKDRLLISVADLTPTRHKVTNLREVKSLTWDEVLKALNVDTPISGDDHWWAGFPVN